MSQWPCQHLVHFGVQTSSDMQLLLMLLLVLLLLLLLRLLPVFLLMLITPPAAADGATSTGHTADTASGLILAIYRDSGKEHGKCYVRVGHILGDA